MNLPFAEEMPFWKTSKSGIESWMDKVEKLITNSGGFVTTRMAGKFKGVEGIAFAFTMEGEDFRITWPVLPTKKEDDRSAAMRQAATMIYHDTKARCNRLAIFGPRVVFMDYLVLENGKTTTETENLDLLKLPIGKQ